MRGNAIRWLPVGVVSAALLILALSAVPFLVTFDGHFYLSGSEVLFTDAAPDNFWWLREPGYSMFLRGMRTLFGANDLWITAIQALLILAGGFLSALGVWRSRPAKTSTPPLFLTMVLLLGVGNAAVMLYSSAALQQAIFVAFLGAAIYLASLLASRPNFILAIPVIVLIVLAAYVQKEFARLLIIPLTIGAVQGFRASYSSVERSPNRYRLLKCAGVGLAVFLALEVLISVALMPWSTYRAEQLSNRSASQTVITFDDYPSIIDQARSALAPIEPHPYSLASNVLAFVGITGSSQLMSRHLEREVYVERRSNPDLPCGQIEGLPPGFESIANFSNSALNTTCRGTGVISFWSPYVHVSAIIYPFFLAAGLIVAAFNILKRRLILPSVTLLVLTLIYSLLGFGADRYSVPLFPVAVAIGIEAVFSAVKSWRSWRSSKPGTATAIQ